MGGVHPRPSHDLRDIRGPFSVCAKWSGSPPARGTRVLGWERKQGPLPRLRRYFPQRGKICRHESSPSRGRGPVSCLPFSPRRRGPRPLRTVWTWPSAASFRVRPLGCFATLPMTQEKALSRLSERVWIPAFAGNADVWGSPHPMGRGLALIGGAFDGGCRFGEVGKVQ